MILDRTETEIISFRKSHECDKMLQRAKNVQKALVHQMKEKVVNSRCQISYVYIFEKTMSFIDGLSEQNIFEFTFSVNQILKRSTKIML